MAFPRRLAWGGAVALGCLLPLTLFAGGTGLNVAVVVNQQSPQSIALGNDYCEQRQVPPQNVFRVTGWTGGNTQWTRADFESHLLNPLLTALADRQLTHQIDFVLLSMDLPCQVTDGGSVNSTTSALFYGFKPDAPPPEAGLPASCSLPPVSSNSYAFSESVFPQSPPDTAPTNAFLAIMLTASNLSQAQAILDHGVASDGRFPTQTVHLAKTGDVFRNVRYSLFDDAIFNTRLRGNYTLDRINQDSPLGLTNLLGYQTGLYQFSLLPDAFIPGAMADSLTSYGGRLFMPNDHTTVLTMLAGGASGSYGTVVEPCSYLEKFPSPQDYFYQARGFTLAEAYYQSLRNPYQGLLVGEPLAAPFALPASGAWLGLPSGAVLADITNLTVQFNAATPDRPLQSVDLFLDGTYLRTLTNPPPAASNLLSVTIDGISVNELVPTNATLQSLAAQLANDLNALTNTTRVLATAHGDRLELRSSDFERLGSTISVTATSYVGGAAALTTFVSVSRTNFLDTVADAIRNLSVSNAPLVGDWLQLDVIKTNGTRVTLAATNSATSGTVSQLVQNLVNQVNGHSLLQGADGVVAEDFIGYDAFGTPAAEFNLRARSPGAGESQIGAILSGSATFLLLPTATNRIDGNLADLQPRNHLYLSTGTTNLVLTFPLDTTALADGPHELTAVAYEGTHVRTPKAVTQNVVIRNMPFTATLTTLAFDTNLAVESVLPFGVSASTNGITQIALQGTGGLLAVATNQSSASFAIAGTNLGVGLHPFYALVTDQTGRQFRTETVWLRLLGPEAPFTLRAEAGPPPTLFWPAVVGRHYDVLAADALVNSFQVRASLVATNRLLQWTETNSLAPTRFYQVRATP